MACVTLITISVHRLGGYRTRVFFRPQWREPDGRGSRQHPALHRGPRRGPPDCQSVTATTSRRKILCFGRKSIKEVLTDGLPSPDRFEPCAPCLRHKAA